MAMHPGRTFVRRLCCRPRMMQFVMWVAAALLFAASAAAQQGGTVTATATVQNRAVATVPLAGGGIAESADSAIVAVAYTAGVRLDAGDTASVRPGGSIVLIHRLENAGTRADRITLSATIAPGWQAAIFVDVDDDGTISGADTVATVLAVAPGSSLRLLVRVTAPADAADSSSATLRLHAQSGNAPAATADALDEIVVVGPRAALHLEKTADRATAAHGDTVTFTLTATNRGDAPSDTASIVDSLPATMRYVPGSLARDGASLPDGGATIEAGGPTTIRVPAPAFAIGASTTVTFRVVVATGASSDSVVNVAVVTQGGAAAATGRTVLSIRLADLQLEKSVTGDTVVALGGELRYRLRATNRSADVVAHDLVLVDTLPDELELVSAEATADVQGKVVTWRVPSLAPGATLTRDITVRVIRVAVGGRMVNRASLVALNAAAASTASASAMIDARPGSALTLAKRAGALEVGLGEAVPYVLTLRNRSPIPLRDILVRDLLPDGMALADRRVHGADSILVDGRAVTMFVAGPVAPDAELVLRYNGVLMSARGRSATNVAVASADGGRVPSDTAVATVRVRRGFEVENRALVGKVWLDRNDNRRQEPGETGVAGVTLWTADGVAVVTDREGRFSLRDLATGQHVLRIDMAKVPNGVRLADSEDDVRVVRTDGWTLPAIEFRLVPAPGAKQCECPDTLPRVPLPAVQQGATLATSAAMADRATEELVLGPAARFAVPAAASIVHAARIYVGVRGEPTQPVRLYVGDSVVAEAVVRPDGLQDFLNVPLAPGPRLLRLWTRNSWGHERWDTLRVHRSGPAVSFALEGDAPVLHPDERSERPVRIRVLDEWGMPVADGLQVTVEATGATVEGDDTDRASLGVQRTVMKDGWISVGMRGGTSTGPATLRLRSGAARGAVTVPVLPQLRPMQLTGSVEVGVGSTTPSYGAVAARGAMDERTAVTVAYDTRRTGEQEQAFGRVVDPLGASQYPTLGDGSAQTSHGTGSGTLSARIERGYDWLEFGDIMPRDVAGSRALFDYRRALTGVQGRASFGAVTVQGFGSFTSQQLHERQLAATSGSGPYALGADLRPGTERIIIEVRARENAARVVDRRELTRVVDYELDHRTGVLLLRRPIASMDASGNPVFIVAYVERTSGGDSRFVGGGRAELGIARPFGRGLFDSVAVAMSAVHDAAGGATGALAPAPLTAARALDVLGADVRLERGAATLELAVLRSAQADTAAYATRGSLAWESADARRTATVDFTRVAPGFGGGLDPRLASGFRELRLKTGTMLGAHGRIEVVHEHQHFEEYGVDRRSTFFRAEQRRGDRALSQQVGLLRDGTPAGAAQGATTSGQGRIELSAGDRSSLWLEATRPLGERGASAQPSRLGIGAGYRLFAQARLEATHFFHQMEEGRDYSTSGLALRTETPFGGRAWGGVERASAARASHAALLGIEQRFRLSHGWEIQGMVERRLGLDGAPIEDPARSLPFAQMEPDRSLAALGLSFMPGADRSRLTLRSELRDGADQRGFRVSMAGDVPLGPDAALLARSDWSDSERRIGATTRSREDRSLLGYAFRPTRSVALNLLAKVEWRRSMNPLGTASLTDSADARRLIATSDAVWKPLAGTELAARYAVRWADWRYTGTNMPAAPVAHYTGLRAEQAVTGRLGARLNARLLREQSSGVTTWSVAPSLAYRITRELRLETGYRAGTLQDLDFGRSRAKLFATVGIHFTEQTLGGAAAFWRDRARDDLQP